VCAELLERQFQVILCSKLNKDGNNDRVIVQEYMGVFSSIYSWVTVVVGCGGLNYNYGNVVGDSLERQEWEWKQHEQHT
jgi:hypothetical protein